MANFPYFRIFPQKLVGTKCSYCGELHGIRYWKHTDLPGLRFNSKKCMTSYIREDNARLKQKYKEDSTKQSIYSDAHKQANFRNIDEIDFYTDIYQEMLKRFDENSIYTTKKRSNPNWVKIEGKKVFVMTQRSKPNYIEIPVKLFRITWDLLLESGEVTQCELSEIHYVKRSAFMLIAFDLLDEVIYNRSNNSLKLV